MHHLIKDTEIIQILNHLFQISRATGQFLLADKGYDSNHFIETIQMQGFTPVIPPRKNRKNFEFMINAPLLFYHFFILQEC